MPADATQETPSQFALWYATGSDAASSVVLVPGRGLTQSWTNAAG